MLLLLVFTIFVVFVFSSAVPMFRTCHGFLEKGEVCLMAVYKRGTAQVCFLYTNELLLEDY